MGKRLSAVVGTCQVPGISIQAVSVLVVPVVSREAFRFMRAVFVGS